MKNQSAVKPMCGICWGVREQHRLVKKCLEIQAEVCNRQTQGTFLQVLLALQVDFWDSK